MFLDGRIIEPSPRSIVEMAQTIKDTRYPNQLLQSTFDFHGKIFTRSSYGRDSNGLNLTTQIFKKSASKKQFVPFLFLFLTFFFFSVFRLRAVWGKKKRKKREANGCTHHLRVKHKQEITTSIPKSSIFTMPCNKYQSQNFVYVSVTLFIARSNLKNCC